MNTTAQCVLIAIGYISQLVFLFLSWTSLWTQIILTINTDLLFPAEIDVSLSKWRDSCVYLCDVHLWDELRLDNLCNKPHTSLVHTRTTNTHITYHSHTLSSVWRTCLSVRGRSQSLAVISWHTAGVQLIPSLRQTEYTFTVIVLCCVFIDTQTQISGGGFTPATRVEILQV